jgi:hypothetical protein
MNPFAYRVDSNLAPLDCVDPFAQACADLGERHAPSAYGSATIYELMTARVYFNHPPDTDPTVTRDRLAQWISRMRGEQ